MTLFLSNVDFQLSGNFDFQLCLCFVCILVMLTVCPDRVDNHGIVD